MIEQIIALILSFFLGTIPFAYFIIKKAKGTDIRTEGSGNVGAMNSYDITQKKYIGIAVFLLDCLKGALAVILAKYLTNSNVQIIMASSLLVILGHNYNPFLKFKGGRGLSTAAGVFFAFNPFVVILWGLLWVASTKIIKNDMHLGNIIASFFMPFLVYYTPEKFLSIFNIIHVTQGQLILLSALICLLILIRHIFYIKIFVKEEFDKFKTGT